MPLRGVLVPREATVPLVARFVGSQAVFCQGSALWSLLLSEPVPSSSTERTLVSVPHPSYALL